MGFQEDKQRVIDEISKCNWKQLDDYEHLLYKKKDNMAWADWFLEAMRDRRQKLRYLTA